MASACCRAVGKNVTDGILVSRRRNSIYERGLPSRGHDRGVVLFRPCLDGHMGKRREILAGITEGKACNCSLIRAHGNVVLIIGSRWIPGTLLGEDPRAIAFGIRVRKLDPEKHF